jgi:predicted Zn-dependent peptidase
MESVETASLGIWMDIGSRHEPRALNGVSHMLEHMVFKGTPTRTARRIAEDIEDVGGHINAYTSRENTAFYAKVMKEDTALALDVISDLVLNPLLDAEETKREQSVVVQEILQSIDTPDDVVFDLYQNAIYPNQALGRSILGTEETVRSFSPDVLRTYLRTNYTPANMIIAAAGKVEHQQIVDLANAALADAPSGDKTTFKKGSYAPGYHLEPRDLEQVHMIMGFPTVSLVDPDYFAAALMSTLFGGGLSSRLFQEVREKKGLVYSISSHVNAYVDTGYLNIYASAGQNEAAEAIPIICNELRALATTVTQEELTRAKAQAKASIFMSMESTSSRCESLARQIGVHGRPISSEEVMHNIARVTLDDIQRITHDIANAHMSFAAIGPIDTMPDHATLQHMLASG